LNTETSSPGFSASDGLQGTFLAQRDCPAICLARIHNQGVILVIQGRLFRKGTHEECLQGIIRDVGSNQTVSLENSSGIGINDKDGLIAGIKQNAVCRFLSYAVDGEQFLPKLP